MKATYQQKLPHELKPGEYTRMELTEHASGQHGVVWFVCTPNGLLGQLSPLHDIEEHEDGTISVMPQPNNSNSILVTEPPNQETQETPEAQSQKTPKTWHGYINHGIWQEV